MAQKKPRGFTLIEQLVGLSAVAGAMALSLPQATELHAAAQASTLASLAAAAQTAMALNQAGCALTGGQPVAGKCLPLSRCEQVGELLLFDLAGQYRLRPGQADAAPGQLACQLVQADTGLAQGFSGPATAGALALASTGSDPADSAD